MASVLELASIEGEFATERGASLLVEITTIDAPWLLGEVERLTTEAEAVNATSKLPLTTAALVEQLIAKEATVTALTAENAAMKAEMSELRWRIKGGTINDIGSSEPTWRDAAAVASTRETQT